MIVAKISIGEGKSWRQVSGFPVVERRPSNSGVFSLLIPAEYAT
jgi:hypothetical protein